MRKSIRVLFVLMISILLFACGKEDKVNIDFTIKSIKGYTSAVINADEKTVSFNAASSVDSFDVSSVNVPSGVTIVTFSDEARTVNASQVVNLTTGENRVYIRLFALELDPTQYSDWTLIITKAAPVVLESISVQNFKTEFELNEDFPQTALLVLTFSNGTTQKITLTSDLVTGFSTTESGEKTAIVTYDGKTCSLSYTVKSAPITLVSLEVVGFPTEFEEGATFPSNVTIKLTYSNGTIETKPLEESMVAGFSTSTPGTKNLTVTYDGKTCTLSYIVKSAPITLVSIDVIGFPTEFEVGDAFPSNAVIHLNYSDGTSITRALAESMVRGFSTSDAGSKSATVAYEDKTYTLNYIVKEPVILASIEVTNFPLELEEDSAFPVDAQVKLNYSDGTSAFVDLTEEMTRGFSTANLGEVSITITYEGKTAIVTYTVKEAALQPEVGQIEYDSLAEAVREVSALFATIIRVDYDDAKLSDEKITKDYTSLKLEMDITDVEDIIVALDYACVSKERLENLAAYIRNNFTSLANMAYHFSHAFSSGRQNSSSPVNGIPLYQEDSEDTQTEKPEVKVTIDDITTLKSALAKVTKLFKQEKVSKFIYKISSVESYKISSKMLDYFADANGGTVYSSFANMLDKYADKVTNAHVKEVLENATFGLKVADISEDAVTKIINAFFVLKNVATSAEDSDLLAIVDMVNFDFKDFEKAGQSNEEFLRIVKKVNNVLNLLILELKNNGQDAVLFKGVNVMLFYMGSSSDFHNYLSELSSLEKQEYLEAVSDFITELDSTKLDLLKKAYNYFRDEKSVKGMIVLSKVLTKELKKFAQDADLINALNYISSRDYRAKSCLDLLINVDSVKEYDEENITEEEENTLANLLELVTPAEVLEIREYGTVAIKEGATLDELLAKLLEYCEFMYSVKGESGELESGVFNLTTDMIKGYNPTMPGTQRISIVYNSLIVYLDIVIVSDKLESELVNVDVGYYFYEYINYVDIRHNMPKYVLYRYVYSTGISYEIRNMYNPSFNLTYLYDGKYITISATPEDIEYVFDETRGDLQIGLVKVKTILGEFEMPVTLMVFDSENLTMISDGFKVFEYVNGKINITGEAKFNYGLATINYRNALSEWTLNGFDPSVSGYQEIYFSKTINYFDSKLEINTPTYRIKVIAAEEDEVDLTTMVFSFNNSSIKKSELAELLSKHLSAADVSSYGAVIIRYKSGNYASQSLSDLANEFYFECRDYDLANLSVDESKYITLVLVALMSDGVTLEIPLENKVLAIDDAHYDDISSISIYSFDYSYIGVADRNNVTLEEIVNKMYLNCYYKYRSYERLVYSNMLEFLSNHQFRLEKQSESKYYTVYKWFAYANGSTFSGTITVYDKENASVGKSLDLRSSQVLLESLSDEDIENALSGRIYSLTAISGAYAYFTHEEVMAMYPELKRTFEVELDRNRILVTLELNGYTCRGYFRYIIPSQSHWFELSTHYSPIQYDSLDTTNLLKVIKQNTYMISYHNGSQLMYIYQGDEMFDYMLSRITLPEDIVLQPGTNQIKLKLLGVVPQQGYVNVTCTVE